MCFNIYWSTGFSALGLLLTLWIRKNTINNNLANGVLFFFMMEFLQVIQYLFIASDLNSPVCLTVANQVLTLAGFIHICLQPYFLHYINESLLHVKRDSNTVEQNQRLERTSAQYAVIKRLSLIGGFLLFLRYPLSFIPSMNTMKGQVSTEWLRGDSLCTFKTGAMFHLGWSVPMADPSYNVMGTGIHSFLMFAPFLALFENGWQKIFSKGMVTQGIICYLTGPFFAAMVTDNMQEQASIWCLFSIAQITITVIRVQSTLLANYGVNGATRKFQVFPRWGPGLNKKASLSVRAASNTKLLCDE